MAKKQNLNPESVLDITTEAQNVDPETVNKIALRRGKVRELMRMGYKAFQIARILEKGVKTGKKQVIHVQASEAVIRRDMDYLMQEDLSRDVDFDEKRAEIKDKLDFLYNRAIQEYLGAKGATKSTFLNTALSVLSKIMEVEGVKSPENLNVNLGAEAKIATFAAEIHKLSENDKSVIITAIRKVFKERQPERVGDTGVSSKPSEVPAQAGNDEGVS